MEYISRRKKHQNQASCDWNEDAGFDRQSHEADLFEQEMDAELQSRAFTAEVNSGLSKGDRMQDLTAEPSASSSSAGNKNDKYDEMYFDSDEEVDESTEGVGRGKLNGRDKLTNDELMYDPNMDDEDQAWIDNIRRQYQTQAQSKRSSGSEAPATASGSDAVLNCPACFTVLCIDCQRHETYKHQYRAMFVMNCEINLEEQLRYPCGKKKGKWKRGQKQAEIEDSPELFNSVKCVKCSTQVGVYDKDEIYHFFNVVASHT